MKTDSKSGPEAVVELRDPHAPDSVKDENDTEKGWAASKKNLRNILACFSSFFVLGANAGAWGVSINLCNLVPDTDCRAAHGPTGTYLLCHLMKNISTFCYGS